MARVLVVPGVAAMLVSGVTPIVLRLAHRLMMGVRILTGSFPGRLVKFRMLRIAGFRRSRGRVTVMMSHRRSALSGSCPYNH